MRPVITPEEARRLDAAAPVPVDVLMDRAGCAVAQAAVNMGVGAGDRVVVLAGRGNNGGDGYVAARYLVGRGVQVVVHSLGFPRGDFSPARRAATAAVRAGVRVRPLGEPEPATLVVDALFGVGFHGTLPDAALPWATCDLPVLAVDVPSGLEAATGTVTGTAFTARRTVTFHALKTGHLLGEGPDRCGVVDVVDIGLEGGQPAYLLCEAVDAPRPSRARTAHKWSAGSVVVVGGAPGLTGAAYLAAAAALATGAGAAAIASPRRALPIYEALGPGTLKIGVGSGERFGPDDAGDLLAAVERYDVMVLGPGLGSGDPGLVAALVAGWRKPLLLDADALGRLPEPAILRERTAPTLLTPHAGEFRRLTGRDAAPDAAADLAATTGAAVLLKGNPTFVVGRERWLVASGGPELATIGTGDVLAGMIGALAAGGIDLEVAARSGAYHHGVAGRRLAARRTVTAEALVAEVARR